MIRRCSGYVNDRRCQKQRVHGARCNPYTPRQWCDACHELKPAPGLVRCGEHGGQHADERRQGFNDRARADSAKRESFYAGRRMTIAERAEVLREIGVLP